MRTKETPIFMPPRGIIKDLAEITGYSRTTITNALRYNTRGIKATKVRELYRVKYLNSDSPKS